MPRKKQTPPIAVAVLLTSIVVIVGCFMTWQRTLFRQRVSGIENVDGQLFAGMAAVCVIFALLGVLLKWFGRILSFISLLLGGVILWGSLMDLNTLRERAAKIGGKGLLSAQFGAGEGLYLVVLGAVLLSVVAFVGVIVGDPNDKAEGKKRKETPRLEEAERGREKKDWEWS